MSDQYNDSGLDVVPGQWSPQEGGQPNQQSGSQQGYSPDSGMLGGPLHMVRQQVENSIYSAIDHYSNQVPGGTRFSPEAKQAVAGILDNLQRQLENEAQNRLGNMGGGLFGGNQGNQGGQL